MLKDRLYFQSVQRISAYSEWLKRVILDVEKMKLKVKFGVLNNIRVEMARRKLVKIKTKTDKDFGNVLEELTKLLKRTALDDSDPNFVSDELFIEKCGEVDHMIEPLFFKCLDRYSYVQALYAALAKKALIGMKRRS